METLLLTRRPVYADSVLDGACAEQFKKDIRDNDDSLAPYPREDDLCRCCSKALANLLQNRVNGSSRSLSYWPILESFRIRNRSRRVKLDAYVSEL